MLLILQKLRKFVPLVGGSAHVHTLLPPLETLAMVDETVVRDKVSVVSFLVPTLQAVESLQLLAADHSPMQLEQHYCPLIKRLAAGIRLASL